MTTMHDAALQASISEDDVARAWNDVETLEGLALSLMEDVRSIEVQLRAPNRAHSDGRRMSYDEWRDWRNRANYARNAKVNLYRRLRDRRKALLLERGGDAERPKLAERIDALESKLDRVLELLEALDYASGGDGAAARVA